MKGLLYKEYRQNRLGFLLTIAISALGIFLPAFFLMGETDNWKSCFQMLTAENSSARIILLVVAYFIVGSIQENSLMGDNTKKWAIFVSSNPLGIKGYMYTKYLLVFAMCGVMYISTFVFDALFCTIANGILKAEPVVGMSEVFTLLFYAQLLIRAINLPFYIRFGMKIGTTIKLIVLLLVIAGVSVFIFTNPGNRMVSIIGFLDALREDRISDTMVLLLGVFPVVCIGAYYLSYRLSCKIYMKGVAEYDK